MPILKERKAGENVKCWPGKSECWFEKKFQGEKMKIVLRSQDLNFKIHPEVLDDAQQLKAQH